jgi:hypothetical protein
MLPLDVITGNPFHDPVMEEWPTTRTESSGLPRVDRLDILMLASSESPVFRNAASVTVAPKRPTTLQRGRRVSTVTRS